MFATLKINAKENGKKWDLKIIESKNKIT